MKDFLAENKKEITDYLRRFGKERSPQRLRLPGIDEDILERLINFCCGGKMLRGALVRLGYSFFSTGRSEDLIIAASAVEMFQSALLIHDDIMDRDMLRRGDKSVYASYYEIARERNFADSYHIGEALGICAGDIAFFIAIEILSNTGCSASTYKKLIELCSNEMVTVGLAQMEDVYSSSGEYKTGIERIFRLYRNKTGRYTFSLPLMMGAVLAGAEDYSLAALSEAGEKMGLIFQIKDDEIGLFGSESRIGKPVGSDIKEGKKTLFAHLLFEDADADEKNRLLRIFGNTAAEDAEIKWVKARIEDAGIKDRVDSIVGALAAEVEQQLRKLSSLPGYRSESGALDLLFQIHRYNLERSR